MMDKVCTECGKPFTPDHTKPSKAKCLDCQPFKVSNLSAREKSREDRGYGNWNWRKLSERARRRQDWCSDCGSPYDLTADHSPEAWRRYDRGLPIRLRDIDVVCRSCNADRGPARGEFATEHPNVASNLADLAGDSARE